jgi:hypothetical protein
LEFIAGVDMFGKKILIFFFIILTYIFGNTYLEPPKLNQEIKVDGNLDEIAWQQAPNYTDFLTFQPNVGETLSEKTIAYSTYDSENLYFAFKCYSKEPDKIQATMTKRDNIFNED